MITDVFTQREAQNGGTGHGERHGERHGEKGSERLQAQRLFCCASNSILCVASCCYAKLNRHLLSGPTGLSAFMSVWRLPTELRTSRASRATRSTPRAALSHTLDPDVVKRWAVCTDGTALRNKRPQKMKLETALGRKQDLGEPTEVLDSDEEVRAVAEMLPIPRSWSRPAPSSASELGRNIRRRLRGKGPCDSIVV